ncbi:MAG: DUF1294 domain-containing protein [Eubacteriales bacterium]|nr:DUF1294 domain-containing protein [Eubacteriales bacterium]
MEILLYTIAVWNLIVFLMYGIDKLQAIKNKWRISEKTLLISAFLLGGVGAFFGMRIWRHKTQHKLFKVLIPLFAILTIVLVWYMVK